MGLSGIVAVRVCKWHHRKPINGCLWNFQAFSDIAVRRWASNGKVHGLIFCLLKYYRKTDERIVIKFSGYIWQGTNNNLGHFENATYFILFIIFYFFIFFGSCRKGQWRGALMFFFICVWINGWVNNREAGDLRCHRAHYDDTEMFSWYVDSV